MGYECPICLEDLNNPAPANTLDAFKVDDGWLTRVCTTSCGHVFHTMCLCNSLLKRNRCPICSKRVDRHKNVRVYLPKSADSKEDCKLCDKLKKDVASGQRSLPSTNCGNVECKENGLVHELLVKDFNEMRDKLVAAEKEIALLKAKNESLSEAFTKGPKKRSLEEGCTCGYCVEPDSKRSRLDSGEADDEVGILDEVDDNDYSEWDG